MTGGSTPSGGPRRLALCWLLAAACSGQDSATPPDPTAAEPPCNALRWAEPPRERNVVLIVSDTMRPDRLGIHGGPARTPAFDEFARRNLLFTRAFSQAPWTKPSIATLFTGLYPSQHSVTTHPWLQEPGVPIGDLRKLDDVIETDLLSEDLRTLAEVMQSAGYRTAGFVSNPWLPGKHGFGQGFEVYDDTLAGPDPPGHGVSAAGARWLRTLPAGERYFLYLHYMDSHQPYGRLRREEVEARRAELSDDSRPVIPPLHGHQVIERLALFEDGESVVESGIPPTLALLEAIYDRGIEDFDAALGELLEELSRRPDFDETAVIVTSDHGEALFTRGMWNHGFGLFDDEIAVPMAMRLPGLDGETPVDCSIGLVDLMATLCVYLGLQCPEDQSFGVSFLARYAPAWKFWATDDREPRYLASEGVVGKPANRVVRNRHYKLIYEPQGRRYQSRSKHPFSLYEIRSGGGEGPDLLSQEQRAPVLEPIVSALSEALVEAVPAGEAWDVDTVPLDRETLEELEALGYLE